MTGAQETVTLDSRGRITIPKRLRNRLQVSEGDDLVLDFDGDEIRLRPRPSFEPIRSERNDWDNEAFMECWDSVVWIDRKR